MKRFAETVSARCLALAVAVPLATGATVAWNPGGPGTIVVLGAMFLGILLGIVGIGLAIEENGAVALAGILFLPPALLLFTPIALGAGHLPVVRLVMALGAIALLAVVLRPMLSRARLAASGTVARHAT